MSDVDTVMENAFTGDPIAQLVGATLAARGMTTDDATQAVAAFYEYEQFGRLVDHVETAWKIRENMGVIG
jgi:hypothetical protein